MSAVLLAIYDDHSTAEALRLRLFEDGFPTDRVELTSQTELGQVKLIPRNSLDAQLSTYFRNVLQTKEAADGEGTAEMFKQAILDGKSAVTVHPRGDLETKRAVQLMDEAGPVEMRAKDLHKQRFEHAASETETPVFTWMGKVLAAPGAPDTTGLARLP